MADDQQWADIHLDQVQPNKPTTTSPLTVHPTKANGRNGDNHNIDADDDASFQSMEEEILMARYPEIRRRPGVPTALTEITHDDVDDLLEEFRKRMYCASSEKPGDLSIQVSERCKALIELDNGVTSMDNADGRLSTHYPSKIHIPTEQRYPAHLGRHYPPPFAASSADPNKPPPSPSSSPKTKFAGYYIRSNKRVRFQKNELEHLWNEARTARCRARFPVPVILWRGKFIVRSATLSALPELLLRNGEQMITNYLKPPPPKEPEEELRLMSFWRQVGYERPQNIEKSFQAEKVTEARFLDIALLNYLRVGVITDLMVENKKKKYGFNVSSSEKVDKEGRYDNFMLAIMPFPGCEFFKVFRDAAHSSNSLIYTWEDEINDVSFQLPENFPKHWCFRGGVNAGSAGDSNPNVDASAEPPPPYVPLNINCAEYKTWSLRQLTLNYLRCCLHHLRYADFGMLVHCISGWDRTPLFVSLLRISLWADDEIHQSLTPLQMMYLTIGYDWYLFGHNLPNRLHYGEDIFFFCFHMLKYMGIRELMSDPPRPKSRKKRCSSSSDQGAAGGGGAHADPNNIILEEEEIDWVSGAAAARDSNSTGPRNRNDSMTGDDFSMCSNGSDGPSPVPLRKSNDSAVEALSLNDEPQPGRSAPMAVPARKRNDSTTSTGSWTVVTSTGSYKKGEGTPQFTSPIRNMDEDESFLSKLKLRQERLEELRNQFSLRYWKKIGRSKEQAYMGNMRP